MSEKSRSQLVAEYKSILSDVINARPSGTRQRLAALLNKNRSFISQLTNPEYSTPIPAKHISSIFETCDFSDNQKEQFLDAYKMAHPAAKLETIGENSNKEIVVNVGVFESNDLNKALEKMIQEYAQSAYKILKGLDR